MVHYALASGQETLEEITKDKRYTYEALMGVLTHHIGSTTTDGSLSPNTIAFALMLPEVQASLHQSLDAIGLRRFTFKAMDDNSLTLQTIGSATLTLRLRTNKETPGSIANVHLPNGKTLDILVAPSLPEAPAILPRDVLEELKAELVAADGDMMRLGGSAKFRKMHTAYPNIVQHEDRFVELAEHHGFYPAEAAEEIRCEQIPPLMAVPTSVHCGLRIKPTKGRRKATEWAA